ncbi:MAG TPA: UDP-N-acetylmuramoyl-tripeptide--D-alanyl-D-alanine ligase [Candidatus Binataceae bacterium]|nr:UDP-N-acetylmuramoyl-tripeptide--D-alanyl-D-alanine ligase [Candidatus Binataceae bacterium]
MATPLPQNQVEMTLSEVAQACGGKLIGDGMARIRGISTDTRMIQPGALFVALRGATSDGHRHLAAARAAGSIAAVTEPGWEGAPVRIEVPDTLAALGHLARFHLRMMRQLNPIPSIAIGGAVGKTTTKDLTAALARARFGTILATTGNLNNLIGVPLTLLALTPEHRAMVIECGTNSPGEIRRLGEMVQPNVALVLNAEIEHTEGLGNVDGIADEEAALFAFARQARVTWNEDRRLRSRIPADHLPALFFGASSDADAWLLSREATRDCRQRLRIAMSPRMRAPGTPELFEAELPLLGAAAALNATAALAAIAALAPIAPDDLPALRQALAEVAPVPGRMHLRQVGALIVLDDSYNASPSSVREALSGAREIADRCGSRLIIALGDMLELGSLSAEMHRAAISDALAARPALLVAVGPEMSMALAEMLAPATIQSYASADSTHAAALIRRLARSGDLILVKGSRGMRMERVIEVLEKAN